MMSSKKLIMQTALGALHLRRDNTSKCWVCDEGCETGTRYEIATTGRRNWFFAKYNLAGAQLTDAQVTTTFAMACESLAFDIHNAP